MSARNAELFRAMHAGIDSGLISQEGGGRALQWTVPLEDVLRRLLRS